MLIKKNYPLKDHNTFGLDAKARFFVDISSVHALTELLNQKIFKETPFLVVGEGSNILFTRNFDGLVIKMSIEGITVIREDNEHCWVKVGAGVKWHHLVMSCIEAGWGGLENLSLIPGTVGVLMAMKKCTSFGN